MHQTLPASGLTQFGRISNPPIWENNTSDGSSCTPISGIFKIANAIYDQDIRHTDKLKEIDSDRSWDENFVATQLNINITRTEDGKLNLKDNHGEIYIVDGVEHIVDEDKAAADYFLKYRATCNNGSLVFQTERSDNICDAPCDNPKRVRRMNTYKTTETFKVQSGELKYSSLRQLFTVNGDLALSQGYHGIYIK